MIYQLAARLKKLREDKRLMQSEAANILGVKPATISLYENGSCQPGADVLVKMAALYGTTIDYILGINSKKSIIVDELLPLEREMLREFNSAVIDYLKKGKSESVK